SLCTRWTCPPHPPPLFPYTTLFRSFADRGQHIPHKRALSLRRQPRLEMIGGQCSGKAVVLCELGQFNGLARVRALQRRRITDPRSEEHTSELQSRFELVCRLLLEKK